MMLDKIPAAGEFGSRNLRLETLVGLRWLAIAGQTVTVLVVEFGLGFPLPLIFCLALIAVSAILNIMLGLRYPASHRLSTWAAFTLLAYDVVQLAGLLYLTGGLENPFAFLLMVPVIVSATTLAPRPTILLGALVVGLASLLAVFHLPLPWYPGANLRLPLPYIAGMWLALVSACVFTGVYTYRVAKEARRLARALNATELVLAREQHLSALDGLAAAAAHELGTPLATIALVAKELERDFRPGSTHADDVALLRSQSQRCRDILTKLTSLSHQTDLHLARLPLSHLIDEVVGPYRDFPAEIVIESPKGEGPEPVGSRNPAIVYGLTNLVENAVDFAASTMTISTEWSDGHVAVTIADDGPGFAAGIMDRIGEPYVTTRSPSSGEQMEDDHEAGGLGLGFFIAKTLLERTGARLHFANRPPPQSGAVIRVSWPRHVMDAAPTSIGEGNETAASWRSAVKSL